MRALCWLLGHKTWLPGEMYRRPGEELRFGDGSGRVWCARCASMVRR
jgi:hypothetical protein